MDPGMEPLARRGSGGFTLIEVLVSLAILALMGVGATALGFSGVISIKDSTSQMTGDAADAQFAQTMFARDVQGSSGVAPVCKGAGSSVFLVGLPQSVGPGGVEYRYSADGEGELSRVMCDEGGTPTGRQVLVGGLSRAPTVRCDGAACNAGTAPRTVSIEVSLHDGGFTLIGTRRIYSSHASTSTTTSTTTAPPTTSTTAPPTTSTTTTTTTPPTHVGVFLALAGSGTPMQLSGSPVFTAHGDAYFNAGRGLSGISISGNPQIRVDGVFALQSPARCGGCERHANKVPTSYQGPMADPLASMAPPDPSGMPHHRWCAPKGRVAVCSPGVYEGTFPIAPRGISDFILEPGVYFLKSGLAMSHGSVQGDEVMLYTANGSLSLAGNSQISVTPPRSGPYAGISVFQNRSVRGSLAMSGTTSLSVPGGTVYGPSQHVAMSGHSQVVASRMVTATLAMSGNAKVSIGDS